MAFRSLAGKMRGLLPRRPPAPRLVSTDTVKKVAELDCQVAQDAVKTTMGKRRFIREEAPKDIMWFYRDSVLIATSVGISVYAVSGIVDRFERLGKLMGKMSMLPEKKSEDEPDQRRAEAKAMSSILEKLDELDKLEGYAWESTASAILEDFEELNMAMGKETAADNSGDAA